jgi:molybdopterin-containing oxidoreductase family membrane subunit
MMPYEGQIATSAGRTGWRTVWLVLTAAGLLAGLGAWIYQLTQGLVVTNMRNPMMWGLYITFFMFFVGLSAGGLIVASAGRLFGGARLKPIVRLAVVEATVAVLMAALFLVPDVGRPDRLWHLFRYPHFLSPMMWDITIVIVYLIISLLYVWVYTRADHARRGSWLAFGTGTSEADSHRDERMKTVLAAVGLPAAVLLHSITAWIFGLQISRGFWYTAVMAPLFISSALVSGTGLMLLLSLVVRRVRRISFPDDLVGFMGKLLAIFLAVEAFLVFSDMLTAGYPGADFEAGPIARLLSGRYAPFFWFEVVAGLVIPFVILVGPQRRLSARWAAAAAVLAVVGIFVHRLNIVLNGLSYVTIAEPPGVAVGTPQPLGQTSFALSQFYYPSWVEWLVALGLLCLGALLFTAAVVKLPLREKENHGAWQGEATARDRVTPRPPRRREGPGEGIPGPSGS